jgi:hypothetical protein
MKYMKLMKEIIPIPFTSSMPFMVKKSPYKHS